MSTRSKAKPILLGAVALAALAGVLQLSVLSPTHAAPAPVGSTDEDAPRTPPRGRVNPMQAAKELVWPLPASVPRSYAWVDGHRMKGYVNELAAISLKMKATGEPYWGRIAGTPSGDETQAWVTNKFKQFGFTDVRTEGFALPVQPIPRSWDISVTAGGKTVKVASASPTISFADYMPSATGDLNLDTVWVGLGMESDFIGKDVRGKAVFIYSEPTPSSLVQSAQWMGSAERAQRAGAAAIIIVLAVPGNMHFVSHLSGSQLPRDIKVPMFTAGTDDGEAVNALNAAAKGEGVKTHVAWKVEMVPGRKAANVIGVLPGMTDEAIVMVAHTDGYFEGANDNGAGTAAMMETAAYYARLPKAQRRRTMYFVATPDHHAGDIGAKWMHENMQPIFAKSAAIVNSEHIAVSEPVWDRRWGSGGAPSLIPTNQLGSSWWGVNGSDKMTAIVRDGFALFGVPTQLNPGGSPGELRQIQFDGPSFYLHNKGVYYHADSDTPDIVPETGLRTAVLAFIKIFDDLNKVDLKDLRPAPMPAAPPAAR